MSWSLGQMRQALLLIYFWLHPLKKNFIELPSNRIFTTALGGTQLRKWNGFREGESLAQGQPAPQKQNQNSNSWLHNQLWCPSCFQTCPKWGPRPTNWPLHQSHFLATGVGSEILLTLILKIERGRRMKAKILPGWYTLCLGSVDIILPTNIHTSLSQHPRSVKPFFGWGCQTNKSSQSRMSSAIPSMPHSSPVPWILSRGNRMSQ